MSLLPFKSNYEIPFSADMKGYKALVITTSNATLDEVDFSGKVLKVGSETGVYASEMTEPYYVFLDAGMGVDVASIKGGKIPVEKISLRPLVRTEYDKRYLSDPILQNKTENSLCIDNIDFIDYDIIFMAGGWGASYDLAQSSVLSEKLSSAYANKIILGGVCHGPLGFIGAVKPDGSALVKDVKMTAVTNRQIKQLGVSQTPKHPESELRNAGADFQSISQRTIEMFNTCVVIDEDHRIVTAQNQKGGVEAADKAIQLLLKTTK